MPLVAIKIKSGNAFSIYALEEDGKCELLEFLSGISEKMRNKLVRYFDRTKDHGLMGNEEILKNIGDKFLEFRTRDGVRVFCFFDAGKMLICTGGYIKKRDKLDPVEIKRAKILRAKYEFAKSSNTLQIIDGEI
jgi:hypothetical protein